MYLSEPGGMSICECNTEFRKKTDGTSGRYEPLVQVVSSGRIGRQQMNISAGLLNYRVLNEQIRASAEDVCISDCFGQRFIGTGMSGKVITIHGTPGNALGAYLNGAEIHVRGNAQDAVGDTMNRGEIVIHGNAGDALGYAMRGGSVYVQGDAGYRTGIHMKEYQEKKPVIILGGSAGSFLGEYLAGGLIIVLGLESEDVPVGNFTGTGMHGGRIFIRSKQEPQYLPVQVSVNVALPEDMREIEAYIRKFAEHFNVNAEEIMRDQFYVLKPNAKNPYKQLYVAN